MAILISSLEQAIAIFALLDTFRPSRRLLATSALREATRLHEQEEHEMPAIGATLCGLRTQSLLEFTSTIMPRFTTANSNVREIQIALH
jgi:hypothetical protein